MHLQHRAVPSWARGITLYQVHALAASGCPPIATPSPPAAAGLGEITARLDDLVALGVGALLLTPVFASTTHGYDTIDPFRLDARLGDVDDIDALIAACHDHGVRLLFDGVFHHVGRDFPRFADVLTNARNSPWCPWFRLDFDRDGPDGFHYDCFEGHRELVAMNHASPDVLAWAIEVACTWLERGIDGWRLDAAYAVPTSFWRSWSDAVRQRFPDALLIGEVIHGNYSAFVETSGLHSVTQYELHKAVWSSCNDHNLHELSWALQRHAAFASTFTPVTFLGNHDVTRIASQLTNPMHLGHALAVLFSVPGIPCLYYGDEVGAVGIKEHRAGGDDAIRPHFDELPDPTTDTVAASVRELHRNAIAFRRAHTWLTDATLTIGTTTNNSITFECAGPDDWVAVTLNLGSRPIAPARPGAVAALGERSGTVVQTVSPGSWTVQHGTRT